MSEEIKVICPNCRQAAYFDSMSAFVDTESYVCYYCSSHLYAVLADKPMAYWDRDDYDR